MYVPSPYLSDVFMDKVMRDIIQMNLSKNVIVVGSHHYRLLQLGSK